MSNKRKPKDYIVGYGKPPTNSRFAKGQSGNPKGRPKSAKTETSALLPTDLASLIIEDASRPIEVRTADGVKSISSVDAVLQSVKAAALKGHLPAQRLYLVQVQQARLLEAEAWTKLCDIYAEIGSRRTQLIEQYEKQKDRHAQFMAHPDDVVLDYETRSATFLGPTTWAEYDRLQAIIYLRSQLLQSIIAWSRISCGPRLHAYIVDRILARFNAALWMSKFIPARYNLPRLETYELDLPRYESDMIDTIIFGAIQPVSPGYAELFQAEPAAADAFFAADNLLNPDAGIANRYSRDYRPTPKTAISPDTRNRIEAKIAKAMTESSRRKCLRDISRDRSLPAYVIYNALTYLHGYVRRPDDSLIKKFRQTLYLE